jgi:DNA-binding NarL/FixJ family response regulator
MMPGLNGVETAERIKAERPECEVLLFSAIDVADAVRDSPAVDRFLQKGDMSALQQVLTEVRAEHGLDP